MSEELLNGQDIMDDADDADGSPRAVDPIAPLRARLLESILPSIETLTRAGRGEPVFRTVEQMRSCFTLARLAQCVLLDANREAARAARALRAQRDEYDDLPEGFKQPLTQEQLECLRFLEQPWHGPAQPEAALLEDPDKQHKWFSWEESQRRAGMEPTP